MRWKPAEALTSLFRTPERIAFAVICGGAVARLYLFLLNRSFWTDEAKLALNVVQRSFTGLLDPLDLDQAAPAGFLFASKAMVLLFGNSDIILRILPLVTGCLALYLMYRLAFRILPARPALLAVLLFTLGKFILYFSTDFKQYSTDVAVALLLTLVAVRILQDGPSAGRFITLAACGILGIVFSFPGVFVAFGAATTLLLHYWLRRDFNRVALVGAISLAWGGLFLLLMLRTLDSTTSNEFLLSYWGGAFMPLPPWSDPLWFPGRLAALFINPVGLMDAGLSTGIVYIAFSIAGIFRLLRRNWRLGLLLFLPLAFALVASALHKYPFADRLMLWAVPALIIGVVEGAHWLVSLFPSLHRAKWVATAAVVLFLSAGPLRAAGGDVLRPKARQHIKPLLACLIARRGEGDILYVYHKSRNPFLYYYPQYGLSSGDFVLGGNFNGDAEPYVKEIVALARSRRVWLLFSHTNPTGVSERESILRRLRGVGVLRVEKEERSASLVLFESAPVSAARL